MKDHPLIAQLVARVVDCRAISKVAGSNPTQGIFLFKIYSDVLGKSGFVIISNIVITIISYTLLVMFLVLHTPIIKYIFEIRLSRYLSQ